MRVHWLFVVVLAGLLGFTPAEAGQRGAPKPAFQPGACPFRVPKGMRISCGFLLVPENRSTSDGRQIKLAVAIARTARQPRLADPVVYLAGGPGSGALASTVAFAQGWASFLAHRDLIMIDQRGTGFSQPSLACTAQDSSATTAEEISTPEGRAAVEFRTLMRCRDRLVDQGVNLGAYTTAESALDLRDLRTALGYKQWNVFGISYGTRLALAALRSDPTGIRSVILDSVYPPQENLFTSMPSSLDHSLQVLYADCAASPTCHRLAPDFRSTLEQLVTRLDQHPVEIAVRQPNGERSTTRIDGARLVEIVFRSLYQSALIPQLPRAVVAASNGDWSLIAQFESKRQQRAEGHSAAMYYAVECAEDLAVASIDARQEAAARYPLLANYYRSVQEFTQGSTELCRAWAPPAAGPEVAAPVVSAVPTLLLAGEYDPITPPAWADAAAATLSHSEVYHVAGTGHAVITRGACPRQLIGAFLDRFTAAGAASCLKAIGKPNFVGP